MKKSDIHIFSGMQRDLSVSKQKPEFLWDAHNIRLTAREDDTMLSVTNEKGTLQIPDVTFAGTYIGHCVINDYLIVFTTIPYENSAIGPDLIYRIDKNDNYKQEVLYSGKLNFDINYPIETLGVYENEFIQKVYWVDGLNQPRFINIVKDRLDGLEVSEIRKKYNDNSFDFVRPLALNEKVYVTRQAASGGQFQSGVIQYAITYYDKYGQETNIAYVTPLYYIAYDERGGSPEEKVGVSFTVSIQDLDTNFDFVRLYSIYRSSINGTPVVKRLADIPIGDNVNASGFEVKNGREEWFYRTDSTILVTARSTDGTEYKERYIYGFPGYLKDFPDKNIPVSSQLAQGKYWHFTRGEFPKLEIHVDGSVITWGSNDDFFISESLNIGGPGAGGKRLITGGYAQNKFLIGSSVNWGAMFEGVHYTDDGTTGEAVDPTSLLYIGGETISASTIAEKDGTLFLGNIKINRPPLYTAIKSSIDENNESERNKNESLRSIVLKQDINVSNYYHYLNTMSATDENGFLTNAAGFKYGETYRFGVQLQYESGKWSDPIFLEDYTIKKTPEYDVDNNKGKILLKVPEYRIPVDLTSVSNGYKKARGVVVFPTAAERNILTQGIASPTVFNVASRANGVPYAQSSWFFRPRPKDNIYDNTGKDALSGSVVEYRDLHYLDSHGSRGAEIQGVPEFLEDNKSVKLRDPGNETEVAKFSQVNGGIRIIVKGMDATSLFAVDGKILTVHSPDIEFDDSLYSMSLSNLKVRTIGNVIFTSNIGDIDIQVSSPTISPDGAGFVHRAVKDHDKDGTAKILSSGLFYSDYLVDDAGDDTIKPYSGEKHSFLFMVYPWHKSGSLNNDAVRPAGKGVQSAVLKQKKISNLRFSNITNFGNTKDRPIVSLKLFNSDQLTMVKLGNNHTYYGNVDTLISPINPYGVVFSNGDNHSITSMGTPQFTDDESTLLYIAKNSTGDNKVWHRKEGNGAYESVTTVIGDKVSNLGTSMEGIRMKYKSTSHFVVEFKDSLEQVLPEGLPLVEIYREDNEETRFGGTSKEAKRNNLWIPAGEPVPISREAGTDTYIEYTYGDTWYQRYDCLKTYPFTLEDENSIVEIASFLVESRINADGRYDKNRGNSQNFVATPTNFNLFNPVYSQLNNFFSYRILDSDFYKLNNFQNSIIWSINKEPAAIVDTWAKVTMANILDLNGNMGEVTKLITLNDSIYCFQESGLSQILFNSRVQIPVSDGVPVEISNNYKVDGNRYLSDSIGVRNKWSIVKSNSGIYFVDAISNSLYNLSDKLTDVSSTHGFSHWFDTLDTKNRWNPNEYSIKSFYDRNRGDLYVTTKDTSIAFSEILGQFTSFMSYGSTPAMFNIGSDFYAIRNGRLWKMFEGEYNMFFGNYYPFDLTFVSNQDSFVDKIFTNLELRADFYNGSQLQHNRIFDYIHVWNEYQNTNSIQLTFKNAKPSNLKKKFRIWRIDIPRDRDKTLDRIRNTWTYVKLGMFNGTPYSNNLKMELHDVHTIYHV